MKKGVTLITDIYKAGVQPRHQFLDLCHVDVSNREAGLSRLALVFHQPLVFEQCNRNLFRLGIDNYFACHLLRLL